MTTNNETFPEVPDQPKLYDWLYHQTNKDVAMYRALTKPHARVLECAVGTGRLAIPIAEQGTQVHGLDYSEGMLDLFRSKLSAEPQELQDRIRLTRGDMREFDLGETFPFVFIPFGSFVYLLTLEDQISCFRALLRHLEPGGTLVLDVPTWNEAVEECWLANDSNIMKIKQGRDPVSGKMTEMWTTNHFDSSTQLMTQDRHYRIYAFDGTLEREQVVVWRSRFFFLGELQLLAKMHGLEIVNTYGDFNFGPYDHHSEVAVIVMHRKV